MATSPLDRGDRHAEDSEWIAAISNWERALATPDRKRAERRIRWFLDTTMATGEQVRQPVDLLIGIGAALLGTILVLSAERLNSFWNSVFAIAAWALYVLAAGCGIAFAFHYRSKSKRTLSAANLSHAREIAQKMDNASATIPKAPTLPI